MGPLRSLRAALGFTWRWDMICIFSYLELICYFTFDLFFSPLINKTASVRALPSSTRMKNETLPKRSRRNPAQTLLLCPQVTWWPKCQMVWQSIALASRCKCLYLCPHVAKDKKTLLCCCWKKEFLDCNLHWDLCFGFTKGALDWNKYEFTGRTSVQSCVSCVFVHSELLSQHKWTLI